MAPYNEGFPHGSGGGVVVLWVLLAAVAPGNEGFPHHPPLQHVQIAHLVLDVHMPHSKNHLVKASHIKHVSMYLA